MGKTRQQLAREALISEGFTSASEMSGYLGKFPGRNQEIVQSVVFDGENLRAVADRVGLSVESVRRISLASTRRAIGRYEGLKGSR